MRPLVVLLLWLSAVGSARADTAALRAAAGAARARVAQVRTEQQTLRQALNQVSTRITELKAFRARGRRANDRELDEALRRSQDLSGSLTGLARSLSKAEADAEQKQLLLLDAVSGELASLRQAFDQTADRAARQQLIFRMRALRAEREQLRAAVPSTSLPAVESSSPDDPEDLLEQADALKDHEDKVRRELTQLAGRIAEAREERELDRRVNEFLGDEAMFDEQDRRFRLKAAPGGRSLADQVTPADEAVPQLEAGGPVGAPGGPATSPPPQFGDGNPLTPAAPRGGEKLIAPPASRPGLAGRGDNDLSTLEAERARLEGLARQLAERARTLEQKARSLR